MLFSVFLYMYIYFNLFSQAAFEGATLDRRYARCDTGSEISLSVRADLSRAGGARLGRVQVSSVYIYIFFISFIYLFLLFFLFILS